MTSKKLEVIDAQLVIDKHNFEKNKKQLKTFS